MSDPILERATQLCRRAHQLLDDLDLFGRWSAYGQPELVGALASGVVLAPDIDMEIYADCPRIADGFAVMAGLAELPGVRKVRFANEMAGPDQGLYWGLHVVDTEGTLWKVDAWLVAHDHPNAHWAKALHDGLCRVLTDETRRAILTIKAALAGDSRARGVDIYRAVIEGGVRDAQGYLDWLATHPPEVMVSWRPE
ncbi:MAG: hypothetical protein ACYC4R_12320 [Anaerolineae bacterium]